MDWQTIAMYAGGALLALIALKFIWEVSVNVWAYVGIAATTLVIALQIAPGLYAGDRALAHLSMAQPNDNARAIDAHREKVRSDIIARATTFPAYPQYVAKVSNRLRRG